MILLKVKTRKKMPIISDTADAVTPGNCREASRQASRQEGNPLIRFQYGQYPYLNLPAVRTH